MKKIYLFLVLALALIAIQPLYVDWVARHMESFLTPINEPKAAASERP